MASLFVIRGKEAGKNFSLDKLPVELGRDANCRIQIVDHEVSRHHASIVDEDGNPVLVDNQSSNGTFVNGHRISRHTLRSGDRLQFGRSLIVYKAKATEPSTNTELNVVILPSDGQLSSEEVELSKIRRAMPVLDTAGVTADTDSFVEPMIRKPIDSGSSPMNLDSANLRSHWEIMYRTVMAVSRTMDIDQLLQQILDFILQGVACDHGCVMLLEDDTRLLRPVAYRSRVESLTNRLSISQSILDYVVTNREGVLTSNASDDQRWSSSESIVGKGIREAICVPMLGRYGLVGAIYVDTTQSTGQIVESQGQPVLLDDHLKLMIAIGHQAALAVEDTFYYRGMVQAERLAAMGQTIATLSHHVKNILQGLNGGSYLVNEGIKRSQIDTIAKGWRIVEKNQERISSLVMDMLTFSKERAPTLAPVDLRMIIDDCLELLATRFGEARVDLRWSRPEKFRDVLADSEAIHRAVLNVLTNALDALAENEKPQIRLELSIKSGKAIIDIIDNGPGIPNEDLTKIFSLFESSKGSRGTGLGLPVTQKILREHGGDILVSSVLGEGCCFSLILPINEAVDGGKGL
jgi:two-component system, NtrC family, sensor kinase